MFEHVQKHFFRFELSTQHTRTILFHLDQFGQIEVIDVWLIVEVGHRLD